jgi:ABC-2 type transport system ATP-binding protein
MSVVVKNVSKLYGAQKALDNVSFEVNTGQVVGLLGPNGAGKSTMMKIICCYLPQSEGLVTVAGYDTINDSINVRKRVGYLPEHNPLYLDMYVKEYLFFVAGIYLKSSLIEKRIKEMVDMTGLGLEQKKKIGELSKGYRQRVGLAQALIHDPEVLVMDEPTSGLDPNQLSEIRSLIKEIGKSKTVILSTHIMQEVEAICDRVLIINRGKIVADDTTAMLRQNTTAGNIFTVEFSTEIDKNILHHIAGVKSVNAIGKNTFKIIAEGDTDVRPEIFRLAVENKYTVLSMMKEEQRLEDVFHQLTGNK